MYIFFLILITAAGFFEGCMDTLQFHYEMSVFKNLKNQFFWDPEKSWVNKYKNNDFKKGPKFPFSTTFLVSLTDGWHMLKLFRNILIFISLTSLGFFSDNLLELILMISISRVLYGLGFWLSYYKILVFK